MVKVATKSRPKSKEKRDILLIWFLIRAFLSIFSDPSGKVQRQQKCNVQRSDAVGTVKGNGYPWISAVPSDVDDVENIGDADAKGIQYPWISPSPSIQETVIMQQTLQEPILPRNACNHVILGKRRVPDTTTVSFCLVISMKIRIRKLEDHTLEAFCVNLLIRSDGRCHWGFQRLWAVYSILRHTLTAARLK